MKFGKRLKQQIDQSLPEWRDKYLSYKELKKIVRLISSNLDKSEAEFIYLLNNEIEKFNAFFLEQEEDFVIRHKELSQRIQRVVDMYGSQPSEAEYKQEMAKIRKDTVDFHGEMVLLMNYSNINYTGLGKILKKYDKRTGGILRLPFIQKVLRQPFFSTDSISKLVKECQVTIESVFLPLEKRCCNPNTVQSKALNNVSTGEEGIFQNTIAALTTMQEIRRGSSTYGHFSLPPLNLKDFDVLQAANVSTTIPIP